MAEKKIKAFLSKAALTILSCFTFTSLFAQQPSERKISGKLLDAVSELPIVGATFIVGQTYVCVTDRQGNFQFEGTHQPCKAQIEHVNYAAVYTFAEGQHSGFVIHLLPVTNYLGYSYVEG
ncbi:MAG: hypothetical protein ACI9HG_001937, partial [Flavobacteriales bacterium]